MSHGHDHGNEHAGHSHGISKDADRRWLTIALLINVLFAVAEVVVGLIANSVALLSDAAHMVTDAGSIGLALFALWLTSRPATTNRTFGWRRAEILSAQFNGATLLVLAMLIAWESVGRLIDPPDVDGTFVIAIGIAGAAVNGAAAWALSRANRNSLNVEGAFLHNLMDLYSSLAAAVGGVAIVAFSFEQADAIAALTVCVLMLYAGWGLLRDASNILLEAAPRGTDVADIERAIRGAPGVTDIHDLHVWEISSGFAALSAQLIVADDCDCHANRRTVQAMLSERFGIDHSTLQVDHDRDALDHPLVACEHETAGHTHG